MQQRSLFYYAVRRSRSRSAEQRSIALYNAYGFGYAHGTSYKDRSERRHMLWPQDLREMLTNEPAGRKVCLPTRSRPPTTHVASSPSPFAMAFGCSLSL